jgi:hypothetical protein
MAEPRTEFSSDRALREARTAVQRSAGQVAQQLGERKNGAAREARGVARALRQTADNLDRNEQASIAGYARTAASAVERLGDSLDRKSPSQMLGEFERVCREHPALVGVGTVVLGFLGARLLRSDVGRDVGNGNGSGQQDIDEPIADPYMTEGGLP